MGETDSEYEKNSTWSSGYPGKVVMKDSMREPSPEKAYIIGVILGDASVHAGGMSNAKKVSLNTKDKEFAEQFAEQFCKWADLRWDGWGSEDTEISTVGPIEKDGNAEDVWMVSKGIAEVYEHLNSYYNMDADAIHKEFKEHASHLLRGLWDSEGHVTDGAKRVVFSTTSGKISKLYTKSLASCISVEPDKNVKETRYTNELIQLRLYKNDAAKFYEAVQPTINRKAERFEEVVN